MYLKSIEIQGFKSFANKIALEFHNGFTAIVGPNGSGKSNIADAVRWVLGEQRVKQLRGGSMQDVIFSGTEIRKPLSSAYVAITFDNSDHVLAVDYKEVKVARRLYRSGESEYLLNNVQVRLRDVQELFYDTGIGKEGYSIIGQGQIDKMLSDKPEDRRELFDEAAGIVKFKRRKETSIRKLESEKGNLVRVSDILAELEKQLSPLEKQAQKAQAYLRIREEQKSLDVNLFLLKNEEGVRRLEEIDKSLSISSEELAQTSRSYEESKSAYDALLEEQTNLESSMEQARNESAAQSDEISRLQTQLQVGEESVRSITASAEHFHSRRENVLAQLKEKESEKRDIEEAKSGIDAVVSTMKKFREEAASELAKVQKEEKDLEAQIDDMRASLLEVLNQRGSIKARQAALLERRGQYEIRKSELTGRLVQASTNEEQYEEELGRLKRISEETAQNILAMQEAQKSIEEQLLGKKGELSALDEELRTLQSQYHQEKSLLDALVNLTERYEGFGGSVQRVMSQKDKESGLIGVVADLIKTQPKYETAIETALGGSIQNIVTDNEDTAKRMIGMLKREKAGRATFLPLSAIRNNAGFTMMGALTEPGVIGLAHTLVKSAPEHEEVARSLLGRTLVVDHYDHAVAISRKYQQKIRIVTLGGELFNAGGSISGGAFRNNSNLLGRRREIAEKTKLTRELFKKLEAQEEKIASTKESRNRLRAQQETLRLQLQGKSIELNTVQMNITAQEEKKKESAEGYASLKKESEDIEATRLELDEQEERIKKELEESQLYEQESNAAMDASNMQLQAFRKTEDEKLSDLQKWDLEVQKNVQKQEFELQELARVEAEKERLNRELAQIEIGIQQGNASMEEKQDNLKHLRLAIEETKKQLEEQTVLLKEQRLRREILGARAKDLLTRREYLSEEKARLDKEVYRLKDQKEKAEESIESQINYLWDEYELTPSHAKELRNPDLSDISGMQKRSDELKKEVRDLGSVNVNAISEYQEVKERYSSMKEQYDDLIAAADSLEKIIEELDTQMRKQFRAQFSKIQAEFNKVFQELFGGGSGKLELIEGEDLLEAGVAVIAQPPGKKLQNMMQMSGGEKSLTAIALLFAIQNLRPSPFCLLDEIEAALDESNVVRFAQYLQKLSKHTQFIVITHRRGTMDRADRLYGITMQEKGVSTLVSVSLISEDDLAS